MTKLKQLARDLGLKTADKISAPPPRPDPSEHAKQRERWPAMKKLAFKTLNPAAIVLVATDGPLSISIDDKTRGEVRRLGHNRGVWPAKLAQTASWKDTVTSTYDKSPVHYLGAQFRVWTPSAVHRNRLAESVLDLMAKRSEDDGGLAELRAGFRDLGPDLDLALFEIEVHDVAKRLGIATWDDAGLSAWLDIMCRRAEHLAADKGRRMSEALLERVMVQGIEDGVRG